MASSGPVRIRVSPLPLLTPPFSFCPPSPSPLPPLLTPLCPSLVALDAVVRRERDVVELHNSLVRLMKFVPDPPISERRWLWRGAEQLGTLQHRLQSYLTELTINGQWVWDEAAVLRHFLQIPVTSESRQAREVLLKDIRAHKLQHMRSKLLDDIRSGRGNDGLRRNGSDDALEGAPGHTATAGVAASGAETLMTPRTSHRARAATDAAALLAPTCAPASLSSPAGSMREEDVPRRRFSGAL